MSSTEESFFHRHKRRFLLVLIILALLLLWFLWPREEEAIPEFQTMKYLPDEVTKSGKYFPLPHRGKPLPGRPDEPMPIPRKVYADVELKINGQLVEQQPIRLPAGSTIQVEGVIWGQPDLPDRVYIDAGIGLVTRAKNKRGWILRDTNFQKTDMTTVSRGKHKSVKRCTITVKNYTLPEKPGEYLLVVVSSATIGQGDHPGLIAAEYQLDLVEPGNN